MVCRIALCSAVLMRSQKPRCMGISFLLQRATNQINVQTYREKRKNLKRRMRGVGEKKPHRDKQKTAFRSPVRAAGPREPGVQARGALGGER